jgi:hypothetical protein
VGGGKGRQRTLATGAGEHDVAGLGEVGGGGSTDPSRGAGDQDPSHHW